MFWFLLAENDQGVVKKESPGLSPPISARICTKNKQICRINESEPVISFLSLSPEPRKNFAKIYHGFWLCKWHGGCFIFWLWMQEREYTFSIGRMTFKSDIDALKGRWQLIRVLLKVLQALAETSKYYAYRQTLRVTGYNWRPWLIFHYLIS